MPSVLSSWMVLVIIVCCLVMHINAQAHDPGESHTSDSANIEDPPIPTNYDSSHDDEGIHHDSEPLRNNGRGSDEANSQNKAAETDGVHGIPFEQFQQLVLDEHNKYRRQMCANDLQNDEKLHDIAMKIAHDMANNNSITQSDDYNYNIYELDTGDPSTITGDMAVKAWYDERKQYSVNQEGAMHFSQLVWKNSNKLGTGAAFSSHKLFIVAVYQPGGNIRGQFDANVGCGSNGQQQQNQANR